MTISEVTARAGIGKGTFYHFYPAKEYYVYAVIQYSKEGFRRYHVTLPLWWRKGVIALCFDESEL